MTAPTPLQAEYERLIPVMAARYPHLTGIEQRTWARTEARRRTGVYPAYEVQNDDALIEALTAALREAGRPVRGKTHAVHVPEAFDDFTGRRNQQAHWRIEVRIWWNHQHFYQAAISDDGQGVEAVAAWFVARLEGRGCDDVGTFERVVEMTGSQRRQTQRWEAA